MSATLPKIDEITLSFYKPKRFIPLVEKAKEYLQNPNFAGRVEIKTELLDKKIELDELSGIVFEKSKQYAENRNDSFKGSVYTIIEFIFKKSASKFYEEACKEKPFFDEIFVLSGTILEPRRKFIIEFLKDPENRKKKILLITTQVVEAGVDIDMDLGFKNQSLIDSDEQLAGRINRNTNKQNCELYLFKHDPPKSIYGKDLRYEITEKLKPEEVKQILTEKDFNKLYKRVFEEIEKSNNSAYKKGLGEYLANFKRFDFKAINQDFRLIESENACVFVPIDVHLNCYRQARNFSIEEERFLNENSLVYQNMVSGEEIWELYVSYIHDKEKKFSVKIKILNGIMSKFVFSAFIKKANELKEYCDYNEENSDYKFFQYLKLKKEFVGNGNLYDFVSGINEKRLDQSFEFI
jgi:CRISPR-associated endonuclease/helicase Cas3